MKHSYTVANLFYIKRDKAGFRNLSNWLSKNIEPSEIVFVKSISSVVTHILIEMENSSTTHEAMLKATGYKLEQWSKLVDDLINAVVSVEQASDKIKTMLGDI